MLTRRCQPSGYAHDLAKYFGDETSVPGGKCGKCSVSLRSCGCPHYRSRFLTIVCDSPPQFCLTGQTIAFDPKLDAPFTDKQVRFVLAVCGVRDDPRMLARLAFGVTSPRITALGLSKHDVFGCCDTADFNQLLERFEAECKENGYRNKAVLAPPKPAKSGTQAGEGPAAAANGKAAKRPATKAASGLSLIHI